MDWPTALSVTSVEMTPIAPTPAACQHSTGSRSVAGRAAPSIGACPYADRPKPMPPAPVKTGLRVRGGDVPCLSMGIVLHSGYTTVVSGDDGAIHGTDREGVYDFDTRLLSRLVYTVGETQPQLVGATLVAPHRWKARLVAPSPERSAEIRGPALPQDTIELGIDRAVGPGVVDRVTITNCSAVPLTVVLCLEAVPDFADVQEATSDRRQRGDVARRDADGQVGWLYRVSNGDESLERGVRIAVRGARPSDAVRPIPMGVEASVAVPPHASEELVVVVESLVDGRWRTPDPDAHDRWLSRWDDIRAHVESESSDVCAAADRAARDIGALR